MNRAKKHHPLVDVKEPNLLEDTYPYSLPPLIRFEGPVIENIDGKAVEFPLSATASRLDRLILLTRWYTSTT
jgi:hypothetical protein